MPAGAAQYSTTGSTTLDLATAELRPGLLWCIEVREEKTSGGLILPDVDDAQKVRIGYCFRIGPGDELPNGNEKRRFIREGDFFIFGKYQSGGEPLTLNGISILQFRQDDIAAKIVATDEMRNVVARQYAKLRGLHSVE